MISSAERTIVAESPVMQEKLAVVQKIAKMDSPVLILGESGTGKELFAERVHKESARRDGPFVSVNCAALPLNLAESELFGHEKGAFSGAQSGHRGRIEQAEGGTLFLDEIADVDLAVQAKLLRFLAEKVFERVGGEASIKADVRIVAATNKNLEKLAMEGAFRKDLYYRLDVLTVRVPPLREREGDILLLADFFLARCAARMGKQLTGFTEDAKRAMMSNTWHGNVRELENCVERASVAADGGYIGKDALFLSDDDKIESGALLLQDAPLKEAVDNFKRNYVKTALDKHNWNKTRAAQALEITRTYLSRLVRELQVEKG